ncbi:MAG: metallophosphoesterase family protein [Candidatus Helarchaeota archaeon]
MIRIACVSDVHAPRYLDLFKASLEKIKHKEIDIFLLAGDIIYKGVVRELTRVITLLEDYNIKFPVYACFGNEEYDNLYEDLKLLGKDKIIFLEDELISLKRKAKKIGIIGTKGSLAQPTWWQAKNIPNIREIYRMRIKKIEELAQKNTNYDIKILLIHYAPTYKTVVGEPERAYPQMGTKALEKVILNPNYKITAVVHGHAHKGRKLAILGNRVPVYNVALPLRKEITILTFPRPPMRGSLLSYFT